MYVCIYLPVYTARMSTYNIGTRRDDPALQFMFVWKLRRGSFQPVWACTDCATMDHSLRVKYQVRPGDELERKIEARTWLRVLGAIFLRALRICRNLWRQRLREYLVVMALVVLVCVRIDHDKCRTMSNCRCVASRHIRHSHPTLTVRITTPSTRRPAQRTPDSPTPPPRDSPPSPSPHQSLCPAPARP